MENILKQLQKPDKVYGLNFTKEEIEEARLHNKILTLDLETSYICNLHCIYCYASSGQKKSNELTLDEIENVIIQAKDCGVRIICIIGGGEPLMHPDIYEIVDFIHSLGLKQVIFTNGVLLNEEKSCYLLNLRVELVVKLNSFNNEVQDFLAGVEKTGERIKKNLEMLQEIGYHKEGLLGIESIICRQNIAELPEIWVWARERGIIPYFEMITFQGRAKDHNLNVTVEEAQHLFETLLKIDEENYGFTWKPHPPIAGLSCQRNYHNLVVAANGFVYPCVGIDIKLGNIRHATLKSILETSPILKDIRNMKENIKGSCKNCESLDECYGCRGMAYHLTGDCFASDPLCWNNTKKIVINDDGFIKN